MKERDIRKKTNITLFAASFLLLILLTNLDPFNRPEIDWLMLGSLTMLFFFVQLLPIQYRKITFTASFGLQIAIFLQYGFIVEAWATLLVVTMVLLVKRETNLYRYIANLSKHAFTSVGAGLAFFAAGGIYEGFRLETSMIFPIIVYTIAYTVLSYYFYIIINRMLYRRKLPFFDRSFAFTFLIYGVGACVGSLIVSIVYVTGITALFYLSVPILTLVFIMKLYNEISQTNERLTNLNKISTQFAAELNVSHAIDRILNSVKDLIIYDYCYLFTYDRDRNILVPREILGLGTINSREIEQFMSIPVQLGDGLSGAVAQSMKLIKIDTSAQKFRYKNEPEFLHHIQSYISVPMIWNNELIGVITLAHVSKKAYTKTDETVMEILASHAAVAIQNAIQFEKTQQEGRTDLLTGLCNYHYFEHILYTTFNRIKDKNIPLTLVLLDIDHFKSINDTYGHLAGNQLLIELSNLMYSLVGGKGVIARYGGEEFTVLFESVSLKEAHSIAETIRYHIEQHTFVIENGLENEHSLEINLTVSIGLATYPDQADDPLSLIRHADRAMYIGAKQAGRNKVASYEAG